MEKRHLVWSATTCDFPGAGVYLGLAPQSEHLALARSLTARQLRVITGGRAQFGPDQFWPLNYYAVRDPSAMRVKPIDRAPLPNGFRHVKLLCDLQAVPPGDAATTVVRPAAGAPAPSGIVSAAFLVSIGMAIAKEDKFYDEAIGDHPDQEWGEVYRRLRELGCRVPPDS